MTATLTPLSAVKPIRIGPGSAGLLFEPDEFLSQLEAEHRVKPEVRDRRGIGFVR